MGFLSLRRNSVALCLTMVAACCCETLSVILSAFLPAKYASKRYPAMATKDKVGARPSVGEAEASEGNTSEARASPAENGCSRENRMGMEVVDNDPEIALSKAGKTYRIRLKTNPKLAAARPQEMRKRNLARVAFLPLPPPVIFLWKSPASPRDIVIPKTEFAIETSAMTAVARGEAVRYATTATWTTMAATIMESNVRMTESSAKSERSLRGRGSVDRRAY